MTKFQALVLLFLLPLASQASRPMATDDAAVVDSGSCQVESWLQRNQVQTEFWAVPACGLAPGLELAAGAATVRSRADDRMGNARVLQLKTVFQPLAEQGWAVGLALAGQSSHATQAPSQTTLTVPFSLAHAGGSLLWHANLGLLRERGSGTSDRTWSLGGEYSVTPRTTVTLETLGSKRSHSLLQLGARHSLIPDRLDLDIALGQRLTARGSERFVVFGLTVLQRIVP